MHTYWYLKTDPGKARTVARAIVARGDAPIRRIAVIDSGRDLVVHVADQTSGGSVPKIPGGSWVPGITGQRAAPVAATPTTPTYPMKHRPPLALVNIDVVSGSQTRVLRKIQELYQPPATGGVGGVVPLVDGGLLCEVSGQTQSDVKREVDERIKTITGVTRAGLRWVEEKLPADQPRRRSR